MQWVKFHVSLLDNDAFKRLDCDERLTFCIAIALAGKQKQDGALAIRGAGPMTIAEIAAYTALPVRRQKAALDGLTAGVEPFMSIDAQGSYVVNRFSEKSGDESAKASNAERQRRFRNRRRNGTRNVTGSVTPVTDIEKEVEKEEDHLASLADSARDVSEASRAVKSPAFAFCEWLLTEGVNAGAIAAHHALDSYRWCAPQVPVAETLIATYGADEGRVRASRFIAARTAKPPRIRRALTVQALLDAWDWQEIRGAFDLRQGEELEDDFIRRLREREERNNG